MIVYRRTKQDFLNDVTDHCIEDIIKQAVKEKLNRSVGDSEYNSWKNSLQYMFQILTSDNIPKDSGIAIEYNIPRSSSRIDFIVSGQNDERLEHAILIELKQWSKVEL